MKIKRLLFCLCFFGSKFVDGQVSLQKNSLIIENSKFSKTLGFSKNKTAPIYVASLTDKNSEEELLAESAQVPWFEFVVDHKLITSSDPLWQFLTYKTREMKNGGKEVEMTFIGKKGVVKGLELQIVEQVFPNSPLMREQLILKTDGNKDTRSTNWMGVCILFSHNIISKPMDLRRVPKSSWQTGTRKCWTASIIPAMTTVSLTSQEIIICRRHTCSIQRY